VLASRLAADNSLLVDLLLGGNQQTAAIATYLRSVQRSTGVSTAFLVSEQSRKYYGPSGLVRTINTASAQDQWYQHFLDSGRAVELNLDRDTADSSRTLAFVNVRIEGADRQLLGVAGLGVDVDFLRSKLAGYQRDYGARLLLVNKAGEIALASDDSSGSLAELPDIGKLSRAILSHPKMALQLDSADSYYYVNAIQIPRSGWTLVVIQQPNAEEEALRRLLIQNTVAALLIGCLLIIVGRLTIGRDQEKLEHSASTDNLSGLLNRQAFAAIYTELTSAGSRSNAKLAIALMDIDHFKRVNDTYGHPAGDAVIRAVARAIKASVRESDPVFRWGGEEFLLLLPMSNLEQAMARLEALRSHLRATEIQLEPTDARTSVTLSFGLTLHQSGESSATALDRADRALYEAKRTGRDRICVLDQMGLNSPTS
jgi:diguanylate cyclase (GGDEF)-like protein